jgi:hypothetical protein
MNEPQKTEFEGGWMYPTEDAFVKETVRFLRTRPKNSGATEGQILSVVKTTPFVLGKQQVDACPESTRGDKAFFTAMRREAMLPTIKKLYNMGYKTKEIADALCIPYSTAYYHCNKIKKHIRTRKMDPCWEIDESTGGQHFRRVKLSRDKAAIAAEREIIRKAKEKRDRRMARRLGKGAA